MGPVTIRSTRDESQNLLHVVVEGPHGPLWDYPFHQPPLKVDLLELGHASKAIGFPIEDVLRVVVKRAQG